MPTHKNMYAFAFAGAFRKIITKMGKRLASQFPNLGIIFGPRRPQTKGQGPQEEEKKKKKKKKEAQGDKETAEPAIPFGHTLFPPARPQAHTHTQTQTPFRSNALIQR